MIKKFLKGLMYVVALYLAIGWVLGLILALHSHAGFAETIETMFFMGFTWPIGVGMAAVMAIADGIR